jgi:hypothetical protein
MSASSRWYSERPEPEETRRGVLRRRDSGTGPGNRPALVYALELADGSVVPIYGPTVEDVLRPLVGLDTVLTGKLVDLGAEGFGVEFWIEGATRT